MPLAHRNYYKKPRGSVTTFGNGKASFIPKRLNDRTARHKKMNELEGDGHRMMVRARRQAMTPARLVWPLLMVLGSFYLLYHALHGERGLYAWFREQRQLEAVQEELIQTKAERERTELRVSHLRDGSLDLDLLDEQMRRMLGVMEPGEVVILTPGKGA